MKIWTWAEIKTEVLKEYDLEDERFITPIELIQYGNKAIDRVEQLIHTIYEDYLLSSSDLVLTAGVSEYALPADIYAHKLVELWYQNGSKRYEIKRIRRKGDHRRVESTDEYMYRIFNRTEAVGPRIKIYPTPQEDLTVAGGIEYIRNMARILDDTSLIDAPESAPYIIQFIKDKCTNKERGTQDAGESGALSREEQLLVETLSNMVPDEDNVMLADFSHYEDMDDGYFW